MSLKDGIKLGIGIMIAYLGVMFIIDLAQAFLNLMGGYR